MSTKKIVAQPLPDRVVISHFVYRVVQEETEHNKIQAKEHRTLYGFADHEELKMSLMPAMPLGQAQDTLLHEAMHAMFNVTGIAEMIGPDAEAIEEKMIQQLTPHLMLFIRNNPDVLAYLCQEA